MNFFSFNFSLREFFFFIYRDLKSFPYTFKGSRQFENFDIYKDLFGTPLSVTEVFKSSKFFKSKLFSWYTFINANIRAINITLKIIREDKHLSANAIH